MAALLRFWTSLRAMDQGSADCGPSSGQLEESKLVKGENNSSDGFAVDSKTNYRPSLVQIPVELIFFSQLIEIFLCYHIHGILWLQRIFDTIKVI